MFFLFTDFLILMKLSICEIADCTVFVFKKKKTSVNFEYKNKK